MCRRYNCIDIAILVSIILGIIAAALSATGVIAVTPAFLWVVGGIAVGYLALTVIISAFADCQGFRYILPVLLTGILGTILLSVILLAVAFTPASIVGAIATGILIIFASLMITATACLAKCLAGDFCTD